MHHLVRAGRVSLGHDRVCMPNVAVSSFGRIVASVARVLMGWGRSVVEMLIAGWMVGRDVLEARWRLVEG